MADAEIALIGRVPAGAVIREGPVVIDARLAPDFPDELFCDPETARKVSARWHQYFPGGMEMGSSDWGNLARAE